MKQESKSLIEKILQVMEIILIVVIFLYGGGLLLSLVIG